MYTNMSVTVLVDLLSYTGKKGGTDTYIRKLYSHISQLGLQWKFHGIASREARNLNTTWFPGEITYSKLSGDIKLHWALGEIFSVSNFARKLKPQIIHCPANFGPIISKYPVVLTLHDALYWSNPELAPNRMLLPGVKFMQKVATNNASRIITDSKASSLELIKSLKLSECKINVIYLGAAFTSNENKSKWKEKEADYILAGGNRFSHKNWETLLKAIQLIDKKSRPSFIITGGRYPDPLTNLVKEYGLQNYVRLLDWVSEEEMNHLYINAKAVIIPSLVEGFSLPALQAMAYEKPLLASKIPVHLEIAEGVAYFFEPNSAKLIADSILEFVNNPGKASKKLKLGLQRSKGFTWDECAKQTIAVMTSLLDK